MNSELIHSRFPLGLLLIAALALPVLGKSVMDFGALGDGKTNDTAAFQKAIDASARDELLIPSGTYLVGSLLLPSNTTLRFSDGAAIHGSDNLDDYPIIKARWEGHWVDAHRGLLSATHAEHIKLLGPGHIIASPKLGGRKMPRQPCVFEPVDCTDVQLDGLSFQQQSMWTIHPTRCENFSAKNLTIRSTGGNGDGIDVDSCRDVTIDHCDIDTGDDCIALKSGRGMEGYREAKPTEHVTISNCTLGDANFACIGIGSEVSGGIRDVSISDCIFTHAKSFSIYIKSNTGRGAFIEDIHAKNLTVKSAHQGFLRMNLTGSGIADAEPVAGDAGLTVTKNLSFENVKLAECGAIVDSVLVSPDKPIDGLKLAHISGAASKGLSLRNVVNADVDKIEVQIERGPLLQIDNVTGHGLEKAARLPESRATTTRSSDR